MNENDQLDEFLDRGLNAAFLRPGKSEGKAAIEATEVANTIPERLGRYAIIQIVGRGGMGLVLRAEDPELGRTLAIKIMRDEYLGDPAMVERFLEEARISSQLQHPGVVPVHDIGLSEGGNPYFAMKLIEGKTLEEIFKGPNRGEGELTSLLDVFETVCQAVAYAHKEGIVHRDLKPANIMVGAFGEVQVMDWGLAVSIAEAGQKEVLRRLVGTPAYMAPEQARVGSAAPDARLDVFALGAILCELLTGSPPYVGETRSEVLLAASRGWQDEAMERLDASGVDAELIALAKTCLSPQAESRPQDGAAVLESLKAYRSSRSAKARSMELAAVEARATAAQERRSRRVVTALSVLVVAVVLVGSGVFLKQALDRQDRSAALRARVESAVQVAELIRRERLQRHADPASWGRALASAQEAVVLAKSEMIGDALRERAQRLHRELMQGRARSLRDLKMVERLLELRPHMGEERDKGTLARQSIEAFLGYGLDLRGGDLAEILEFLQSSTIRKELSEGIDELAFSPALPKALRGKLRKILSRSDPNPWRQGLRDAVVTKDVELLLKLARSEEVKGLPAQSLDVLAKRLDEFGKPDEALRIYGRAVWRFPNDFQVVHNYASLLRGKEGMASEVIRLFSVAGAVRPRSPHVQADIAHALILADRLDDALKCLDRSLEIDPGYPYSWFYRGIIFARKAQWATAASCFREALKRDPRMARSHSQLAIMELRLGHWSKAESACRKALDYSPDLVEAHTSLVTALDAQGKDGEALSLARRSVELAPRRSRSHYNLALVLQRLWHNEEALREYSECLKIEPDFPEALCNQGTLLCAMGKFEAGLAGLRRGQAVGLARAKPWHYPSKLWIGWAECLRDAEELVEDIEDGLPPDLAPPAQVIVAEAASYLGKPLIAARLFESIISTPQGLAFMGRNQLRCAAALGASLGVGRSKLSQSLSPKERRRWRNLALLLLRHQLRSWKEQGSNSVSDRRRDRLLWSSLPAFLVLRNPPSSLLKADEAAAWAAFWKRLDRERI